MIIFLYTTNQHQKWDNFYFEHFPQNSKLTLDRPHRIRRAPVDQVTPRVRRAFVENFFIFFLFANYCNTHIVLYQQALSPNFFNFFLDRALVKSSINFEF